MRKTLMAGIAVVTLVASALVGTTARQEAASTEPLKPSNTLQPEEAKKALAKQPLRFEANLGQTDSEVRFLSRGSGYSMFLTPSEAVLSLARPDQRGTQEEQSDVVRMRLVGARPEPEVRGTERLPGVSNYILGNDAKSWVTGVPSFGGVNYAGVYPGVDLVYHGDDQGRLEYDFIVAPGADAGPIAMAFSGAKGLRLDSSGELVMATAGGEIRHHKPTLYQDMDGARQAVSGRFVMKGDSQVGFEVGAYDRSRPLVIDPVLAYSTFLGGIGADEGSGIAVDSAGNAYVTGLTTSTNFPRTEGALDLKCGTAGDCDPASNGSLDPSAVRFTLQPDAFVTKLAPGGDSLVYSTYLGGKGADRGLGIAVDANGNAYVTGSTASSDFPTTANAFDTTCGSDGKCDFRASDTASDDPNFGYTKADAFMTKLNPSGSALSYATFIGGRGEEDLAGTATYQTAPGSAPRDLGDPASRPVEFAGGLAVDGETAYVTGTTLSPDFRTTDNAYDRDCGTGTADCNKSQSQIEGGSTGGGVDPCRSPAPPGCITVFPDAFLVTLDTAASTPAQSLLYSSYFGGSNNDIARGVAIWTDQPSGRVRAYITGSTATARFQPRPNDPGALPPPEPVPYPTTSGAFQTTRANSFDHAFLTSVEPALGGQLSMAWSTFLNGGQSGTVANSVAVDTSGSPYVTGVTGATDNPNTTDKDESLPTTSGAFQRKNPSGSQNVFITKFTPDGSALLASTYLGGATGGGQAKSIAVDGDGHPYVTGVTNSTDFPTHQPVQGPPPQARATAFVSALKPDFSGLEFSTYLGGSTTAPGARSNIDQGLGIAVGKGPSGGTYVTGYTDTSDFPRVAALQSESGGSRDAFVAKIVPSLPTPRVTAVSPATGVSSGGTSVTIGGTNLGGASAVHFGDQTVPCPSPSCTPNSEGTQITATSPPFFGETPTVVDVTVTTQAGTSSPNSVSPFTYYDGDMASTASTGTAPYRHTATLLSGPNCGTSCGKVLVVSGGTAELYDPSTATWSSSTCSAGGAASSNCPAPPPFVYDLHTATPLTGACTAHCGKVLVAGGGSTRTKAALYNPATGTWTTTPDMNRGRAGHAAALLAGPNCGNNCGKVLVVGGSGGGTGLDPLGGGTNTAELFDPAATAVGTATPGAWTLTGAPMDFRREGHSLTLITGPNCGTNCGKVLLLGGTVSITEAQGRVELYEPAAGAFTSQAVTALPRSRHTATTLADGKVLIAGGFFGPGGRFGTAPAGPTTLVEVYDPAVGDLSQAFKPGPELAQRRMEHAAALLPGGRVVVSGGFKSYSATGSGIHVLEPVSSTEVYDPNLNEGRGGWRPGEAMPSPVGGLTATLLTGAACATNCDKVLIVGGNQGGLDPVASVTKAAHLYTAAPRIADMAPTGGPGQGGTTVAVAGFGFGTDTSVRFGDPTLACGTSGPPCEVQSYSRLNVVSPGTSKKDAAVNVWVIRKDLGVGRSPKTFTYAGCRVPGPPGALQAAYPPGWSLVAAPAGTVVGAESPLYGWFDQNEGQYSVQPSTQPVAAGRGYWAYFSCPRVIDVANAGTNQVGFPLGAYNASMVGNPSGTRRATITGHDFTARWDPARNGYDISGYRQAQGLAVGEGVWAFSYEPTTLTIRAP